MARVDSRVPLKHCNCACWGAKLALRNFRFQHSMERLGLQRKREAICGDVGFTGNLFVRPGINRVKLQRR